MRSGATTTQPHPGWGPFHPPPAIIVAVRGDLAQAVLREKPVTIRPHPSLLAVVGPDRRRARPGVEHHRHGDRLESCAGSAESSRLGAVSTAIGSPRCRRRSRTEAPIPREHSWTAVRDSPCAGSRSSTSTAVTSRSERGRHVHRRPERRDLQLRRADAGSRARGAPISRLALTPRRSCTPTRNGGSGSRSGCAGCSRSRSGTRRGDGSCWHATGSGSSRSTTATSATSSRSRPSSTPCPVASSTSTLSRRSSRSTRSRHRFRSFARSTSCRRDTC